MSFNGQSPDDPSASDEPSATDEIKTKLDDILAHDRAQLVMTVEMRQALADIRRRINAAGPLVLPRPTPRLPQAPKRRSKP